MIPTEALIAVYDQPNASFELRMFPVRSPRPGEVLVKVRMCTICRSDIHSYQGHRPSAFPGLLGHEIIGNVIALGEGIEMDMRGATLRAGDRITWSEYFVRADNYQADVLNLPQKSPGVDKYGHMSATTEPHHHGGFGQYCYILPKSWILRLPDELSDEEATPINCGVATMICVTEKAEIGMGDSVVVQGLGLLGLYGAAIAKARGARLVIGIDAVTSRRELGKRFGCDHVFDPAAISEASLIEQIRELCRPDGADAVIEVCGNPQVIPSGIQMARVGGRYALAGALNPGSHVLIDASQILRRLITLRGVHNYHPRHLVEALDFVTLNRQRFPFKELVDAQYPLDQVGQAMKDAADRTVLRAAIVP